MKKGFRGFFLSILCLTLPAYSFNTQSTPYRISPLLLTQDTAQDLEGIWEGEGYQGAKGKWSIKVTIQAENYTIEYPSLQCGGSLKLKTIHANSFIFEETITHNIAGECIEHGKTILEKSQDGSLRYHWYFSTGGKKEAFGNLSRHHHNSYKNHIKVSNGLLNASTQTAKIA
jgi:hypothetical protein